MRNSELKIYPTATDHGTETVELELDARTASILERAAFREGMSKGQLVTHLIADYADRAEASE